MPSPTPIPTTRAPAISSATKLELPFWVPEHDADAAENPELIRERQPSNPVARFYIRLFVGPGHRVDRVLQEGDEVAGFKVLDAPGHSAGHVVFWRESDRVLILGDVLATLRPAHPDPRPARAEALPDPRPGREPALREAAGLARAEARAVRSRHTASRHEEVRRVRRLPARLSSPPPLAQKPGLRHGRAASGPSPCRCTALSDRSTSAPRTRRRRFPKDRQPGTRAHARPCSAIPSSRRSRRAESLRSNRR